MSFASTLQADDLPAPPFVLQEPLLGGLGVAVAAGAQGVVSTGTLAWALKLVSPPFTARITLCALGHP